MVSNVNPYFIELIDNEVNSYAHQIKSEEKEKLLISSTSTESIESRPISIKTRQLLDIFYSIANHEQQVLQSTCVKIVHISSKLFLGFICYSSTYAGIEPAKRNFSNIALQNTFGYGDAFAWGTQLTYCAIGLYGDIFEKNSRGLSDKKDRMAFIAHWFAVIFLGLLSEIPSAYTNYYYNQDSPFVYIYTPFVASFFAMLSTNELLHMLSKPDGIIKRHFISPNDLKIYEAKNQFCQVLRLSKEVIQKEVRHAVEFTIYTTSICHLGKRGASKLTFFKIFKIGVDFLNTQTSSKSRMVIITEKIIMRVSIILPLGSPILDSILLYKGYHLILNQDWPIPFLIFFAVGPGIYLQIKSTQDFYLKFFQSVSLLLDTDCSEWTHNKKAVFNTSLKCFVIGILTVFGLAADVTVVRDNIGFDTFYGVALLVSVVSTMSALLILSMDFIYDDLVGFYERRKNSVEVIQSRDLIEGIDILENFFGNLTATEFENSLSEVGFNPEVISQLNNNEYATISRQMPLNNDIDDIKEEHRKESIELIN